MTTIKLPRIVSPSDGRQPRERVTSAQRHTRRHPCPICRGGYDDPRGRGMRCSGFTSANGRYAYGAASLFPDGVSGSGNNYSVDVVFAYQTS